MQTAPKGGSVCLAQHAHKTKEQIEQEPHQKFVFAQSY